MIKKVIEKISTSFNTKGNISNINVKYDKINKKYNVTVRYKKIIKKTIRFNPTGEKNPGKIVITKKYNLTLEPDELNDNIINFNEKDGEDNKNNDINTDLKNKKDNINTYPHSFSFDNIHYYSNIVINESYLIRECIHKDITAYIQKNGKDIDPKNPPKEFNITVKITTLHDRHDFEFERWDLSVTYAPNEHSPLNTIQLKYCLEDTIFGKCVCNYKEEANL